MLVYDIGDVIVIAMLCAGLIILIAGYFMACVIRFFDWIRRKRK